ncbi:MAG: CotH kinase family protein [Bacteroidota bacterium]
MKNIILLFTLLISFIGNSQTLPSQMYYSADGKILYTGGVVPTSGFYNKNLVKDVYLNFTQSDYWTQLTNNYASETNIAATMIYDGVTYPNVGVRFRGNTSYTTIGASQKKSFSVETDFVDDNLKIDGYNDLKFNNAHQDPTFMREVLYNRMARRHMPIAKGNYVHLYLNNIDWGIYPNIQAVDKTFLDEWWTSNDGARFRATTENTGTPGGGWGDGTAGMNYLGTTAATYQQYYTLKSNDVVLDPWQTLIDATLSLSTATAANSETVKTKIDVDKVLWHLACENIFTDDDSYIMKGKMDYMVYYEPETGRTTSFEYDGNSTFVTAAATSANWGPFKNVTNANYPLLNKLINIPEWRQRYLAHYRTILTETFTTANANALVDELDAQISALVAADTKKLYSTAQYTSGVPGLKTFVANRRTYLLSNTEVAQVAPIIASAKYHNSANVEYMAPVANEVCNIKAVVTSTSGINKMILYYATGLVGNFAKIQMYDDGTHNDDASGDGIFGAQIPGYAANTLVRYYVEAVANNATLSASYLPTGAEHDIFVYTVTNVNVANGVVVNEIMAQNTTGTTDEVGDYEDWVELYNNNNYPVDLSGYYLSDSTTNLIKWQFPSGAIIAANSYMVIWADDEAIEGPLHAAWKLSVGGESVTLSNPSQNIVDQVIFGAQTTNMGYARVPNGTGGFVIQAPTFNGNNQIPLGTSDFEIAKSEFIMYPNPASTSFNLNFSEDLVRKNVNIHNNLGQRIFETKAENQMEINTSGYASGVYFVTCDYVTKKLIIK